MVWWCGATPTMHKRCDNVLVHPWCIPVIQAYGLFLDIGKLIQENNEWFWFGEELGMLIYRDGICIQLPMCNSIYDVILKYIYDCMEVLFWWIDIATIILLFMHQRIWFHQYILIYYSSIHEYHLLFNRHVCHVLVISLHPSCLLSSTCIFQNSLKILGSALFENCNYTRACTTRVLFRTNMYKMY